MSLRQTRGGSQPDEDLTFEEFCRKHYFPWAEAQIKSFRTRGYFNKWILPAVGKKKINEITALDIEKLKIDILKAGKAPRTAHLIRAVLNRARKRGFLAGNNPASGVQVPRFDNRRVRFLTPEEAQKLLEECKRRTTPRNLIYPIVLLAITTGIRAGEIFRLKIQDLDLKEGVIHVRDAKPGKNGVVYVPEEVKEVLLDLIKEKKTLRACFH